MAEERRSEWWPSRLCDVAREAGQSRVTWRPARAAERGLAPITLETATFGIEGRRGFTGVSPAARLGAVGAEGTIRVDLTVRTSPAPAFSRT